MPCPLHSIDDGDNVLNIPHIPLGWVETGQPLPGRNCFIEHFPYQAKEITTMASVTGEKLVQIEEAVRSSVQGNAQWVVGCRGGSAVWVKRYECAADRIDKWAGSYDRKSQTKAGEVTLKVPRL